MPLVDDHDKDEEEMVELLAILQVIVMYVTVLCLLPIRRYDSIMDQRLAWKQYCGRHHQRGTLYDRRLRMRKASFDKLVALLADALAVDEVAARRRGGAIIPEICVYCMQ
jgi:hypothetical protein